MAATDVTHFADFCVCSVSQWVLSYVDHSLTDSVSALPLNQTLLVRSLLSDDLLVPRRY